MVVELDPAMPELLTVAAAQDRGTPLGAGLPLLLPETGLEDLPQGIRVTAEAGGTVAVSINEVPNSVGGPPNSIHIQLVDCADGRQIGDTAGWDRDEDGVSKVLAKDLVVDACFQLRLSADSFNWFTIEGQVTY